MASQNYDFPIEALKYHFQVEALLVGKYQVVQNEKPYHFCKSTLFFVISGWLLSPPQLLQRL